jgi:hypothetical protein
MVIYVIALHQLKCYNADMFRVYLSKCHCKLIIKTLDLHKTVIKGEINKISPLMLENKKPQIKYNYDFEESFDFRAHSFFNLLVDLEKEYVKRYFNVLQLYPRSDIIVRVKKKLYSLIEFLSGDLNDVLPVSFSSDEVIVIKLSLWLYFNLLCGKFEAMDKVFEGLNISLDIDSIILGLCENRDLFTNLVDKNSLLDISSNLIYYKGKWAWDLFNVLEGNGSDKIGSIPLIKIEEVNDSRCFWNK